MIDKNQIFLDYFIADEFEKGYKLLKPKEEMLFNWSVNNNGQSEYKGYNIDSLYQMLYSKDQQSIDLAVDIINQMKDEI